MMNHSGQCSVGNRLFSFELAFRLRNSLNNSAVIPAERAGARESRNPGNQTLLDTCFRGHDAGEATDFF
jgi:hypothetical protein